MTTYRTGNIGDNAFVQIGQNLINISINNPQNSEAAIAIIKHYEGRYARYSFPGSLNQRLEPLVLVNRSNYLVEIAEFFKNPNEPLLYIVGLAGIGKSSLARGALEFRTNETPVVWISCKGTDTVQLLSEINYGLKLKAENVLEDKNIPLQKKTAAILGSITSPSIIVLDNLESLLNEDGKYTSEDIDMIMKAFANFEHNAKVILTTRRLPYGIGTGNPGLRIMYVRGLDEPNSRELFRIRAGTSSLQVDQIVPSQIFSKLEGHPKFIEMCASAISEMPVEQIISGLLTTTDIGEFITIELLKTLNDVELKLLQSVSVFQASFTYDAMNSVYYDLYNGTKLASDAVRSLVKKSIMETSTEDEITYYYLHSLIRDAVTQEPRKEAAAHAAAAKWFLRRQFDPLDFRNWDNSLYHLRRAAELGKHQDYFRSYFNFITEIQLKLSYAGWSSRLLKEYYTLLDLAENDHDKFLLLFMIGTEYANQNMYDQAEEALGSLAITGHDLSDLKNDPLLEAFLLVKTKLGSVFTYNRQIEKAINLANEIAPFVTEDKSTQLRLRYHELLFNIARRSGKIDEMLPNTKLSLELATKWFQEDPSVRTRDAIAEAHFRMGVYYLRSNKTIDCIKHLKEQLRIKIEIGKLSGIAAALTSIGMLEWHICEGGSDSKGIDAPLMKFARGLMVESAAMLLTSEQIQIDIQSSTQKLKENEDLFYKSILVLNDNQTKEAGRNAIAAVSNDLVAYYDRALERRSQML